jgi:hypothetical protein
MKNTFFQVNIIDPNVFIISILPLLSCNNIMLV